VVFDCVLNAVLNLLLFFFFQAEDGIRDGHVTGVQTCALPILPGQKAETDLSWQDWSLPMAISPDGKWVFFAEEGDAGGPRYSARSEERRVGEEGRSGVGAWEYKKNDKDQQQD